MLSPFVVATLQGCVCHDTRNGGITMTDALTNDLIASAGRALDRYIPILPLTRFNSPHDFPVPSSHPIFRAEGAEGE